MATYFDVYLFLKNQYWNYLLDNWISVAFILRVPDYRVLFLSIATGLQQDYVALSGNVELDVNSLRVRVTVATIDDLFGDILEDIELFQVILTSNDDADVRPEQSLANIFIIDNDGSYFSLCIF